MHDDFEAQTVRIPRETMRELVLCRHEPSPLSGLTYLWWILATIAGMLIVGIPLGIAAAELAWAVLR